MIAVMGATGQVGGAVLRALVARRLPARAVVRDPGRAAVLEKAGAEVVRAEASDDDALTAAFRGCVAIFAMNPPAYASRDMVTDAVRVGTAIASAAQGVGVGRVVLLSSVGADRREGTGNIRTTHAMERELRAVAPTVVALRAAWFLENWLGAAGAARAGGSLPSFLADPARPIEMVATRDIGATAADLLTAPDVPPVVELAGPRPYSPNDIAAAIRPGARAVPVGAEGIRGFALSHGMSPEAAEDWVEMVAGFDTGRISFTGRHASRRGPTTAEEVLRA